LIVVAGAVDSSTLYWVGLGGFVFGPPIVHAVHGRIVQAIGSVGVRVAVVLVVWFIAVLAVSEAFTEDGGDGFAALAIATLVGVVGASALDAAVFGFERVRVDGQALVRPWYDARSGSAGLRVGGTF
jgi:hypothetical protein